MWSEGEEETVTPLTSGSDHPSPASCLAGMWSEDEGPVMVVPTPRRCRPSPQSESSSCSEELDVVSEQKHFHPASSTLGILSSEPVNSESVNFLTVYSESVKTETDDPKMADSEAAFRDSEHSNYPSFVSCKFEKIQESDDLISESKEVLCSATESGVSGFHSEKSGVSVFTSQSSYVDSEPPVFGSVNSELVDVDYVCKSIVEFSDLDNHNLTQDIKNAVQKTISPTAKLNGDSSISQPNSIYAVQATPHETVVGVASPMCYAAHQPVHSDAACDKPHVSITSPELNFTSPEYAHSKTVCVAHCELFKTMRPASALPSPGPASASPSTSPVAAMPPSGPALSDPMPTKPRPVRPMLCSRRRLPHGRPPDPLCSHHRRCHPHSRPPELNCFALLCCHPLGRPPELFLICSLCSGFCGSLVFGLDPSVLGPHRPPWSGCFLFSVSIGLSGASP
ncbi:unnamed protein product [Oreochromis niloticus]|nr:unnamed protein product [Mustela putorius furo]